MDIEEEVEATSSNVVPPVQETSRTARFPGKRPQRPVTKVPAAKKSK